MTRKQEQHRGRLPAGARILVAAAWLLAGLAAAGPCLASEPAAANAEAEPVVADPAAIIDRAGAFYAEQSELAARMVVKLEMPARFAQMGNIPTFTFEYRFRAPNSVALAREEGGRQVTFVQDGQQLISELPTLNSYVLREAMSLAELCTESGKRYLQAPGAEIVLGLGLEAGVPGALRGATEVRLIGSEPLDGIHCYRLSVMGPGLDGEIWIAEGDRPWVMRFHQPPPDPGENPAPGGQMVIRPGVDLRLENWQDEPDLETAFTIEPPAGKEKLASMPSPEEIMRKSAASRGRGRGGGGEHASTGKPAPAVQLQPMDGEPFDLASLRGKVVVLDFWATWCKPCVMALPLVTKVTSELADRGVVFYAVNQGESSTKVKAFLDRHDIHPPVALDPTAKAGRSFGVSGIPHSVVIDKEGVVRKVHVGFAPGLDRTLREEIEELLEE